MTAADLQMQRAVLALVLREDPDVLTLPALAGRVLANPRSLTGGVALARALRELDNEGLVLATGSWCGRADQRFTSSACWGEADGSIGKGRPRRSG